jgi:hypothetical protein
MPYYLYKISPGITALTKDLQPLGERNSYQEAKDSVRELRAKDDLEEGESYKMVYAKNALHAEEILLEKRDKPILREWEK